MRLNIQLINDGWPTSRKCKPCVGSGLLEELERKLYAALLCTAGFNAKMSRGELCSLLLMSLTLLSSCLDNTNRLAIQHMIFCENSDLRLVKLF